jgi:hypothetical protein
MVATSAAQMILSTVRLAISAQLKPEVLRTLRVLMGHATAKAGCAGFSLFQGVANPEALTTMGVRCVRTQFASKVSRVMPSRMPAESGGVAFDRTRWLAGRLTADFRRSKRRPGWTIAGRTRSKA